MRKHVEESAATGAAAWRGRGGRFSAGEQHAVAVAGVRHVTPFKRAHFRPPQPAHEQQRGDHGVESAPAVGSVATFGITRESPLGGPRYTANPNTLWIRRV